MKLKLLAGAALVGVFAASGAFAAPADTGWYGAVDVGGHIADHLTTTSAAYESDMAPYAFKFSTDTDWLGFARIGYKVSPRIRIELEGGYRPGNISSVIDSPTRPIPAICAIGTAAGCPNPGGSLNTWSLMSNFLFDILPDNM